MPTVLDAERMAREELESGEELVWAGKPLPGKATGRSTPVFLFGLVWTALSVFWTLKAVTPLLHPSRSGAPISVTEIAFVFFGIPALIIGFGLLSSPFWAYRLAGQTVYAVTNKRLLIVTSSRTRNVQSISPQTVANIDRRERADGAGDLIFKPSADEASPRSTNTRPFGFYGVSNVRNIECEIRKTFPEIGS